MKLWRGHTVRRRARFGPVLGVSSLCGPSSMMVALAAVIGALGGSGDVAAQQEQRFGGCPRVAFRAMFEAAADHDEVGDIAAVEREAFTLCVRRQELINEIVAGEARLVVLVGDASGVDAGAALEPVASVTALPAKAEVASVVAVDERPGVGEPFILVPGEPEPEFRWTVVYGSAGEWIAGVSDGAEVWYVRAGDELPSGIEVVEVRLRPPGVEVKSEDGKWFLAGPRGTPGVGQ